MDVSFQLLSSMSPKIKKNIKPSKKAPTILALKKHVRRSSAISTCNNPRNNESIITLGSTSSLTPSSCSSSEDPVLISKSSEASFSGNKSIPNIPLVKEKSELKDSERSKNKANGALSREKFGKIKRWVDDVNSLKKNSSTFNGVSTICVDDDPSTSTTTVGTQSTFLQPTFKKLEEFEDKNLLNQDIVKSSLENANIIVINDSLITEDGSPGNSHNSITSAHNSLTENSKKMLLKDSLELDLNESQTTPIQAKSYYVNTILSEPPLSKEIPDADEFEELLDSIYGQSWRQRKEDVLPSSEHQQLKRKGSKINKIVNMEKSATAVNVYRNHHLLRNDFDSTSGSTNSFTLLPVRLNFKEDEDLTLKKISPKPSVSLRHQVQIKNQSSQVNESPEKVNESKTESGTFSFLASLSANIPVSKSDVSSLIYKSNFKQHRVQLASKLFNLYNERIFDNVIPSDTPLEWNDRMRGTAGYCYCKKITRRTGAIERTVRIVISSKVVDSADRLRDTLVHEMCHAVTWIVNQVANGHGIFWKFWADCAMKTFPELPPIKRCHQYVINTKYTYRCVKCGYSVGRHTKSLDIERKRCGCCYGKFEILINKTTKKGETRTVPVTPKKAPTGFALFVKENYANFKTPELRHADVMKILGQKFSNLKVDKSEFT